jgi:hypothetical protein
VQTYNLCRQTRVTVPTSTGSTDEESCESKAKEVSQKRFRREVRFFIIFNMKIKTSLIEKVSDLF